MALLPVTVLSAAGAGDAVVKREVKAALSALESVSSRPVVTPMVYWVSGASGEVGVRVTVFADVARTAATGPEGPVSVTVLPFTVEPEMGLLKRMTMGTVCATPRSSVVGRVNTTFSAAGLGTAGIPLVDIESALSPAAFFAVTT